MGIAGHELLAPRLPWSETASVLRELARRREISVGLARSAFDGLRAALIAMVDRPDLADAACSVADALGWARTYDAEDAALARALDCPLLTLDARLARTAGRLVRVVGFPGRERSGLPIMLVM